MPLRDDHVDAGIDHLFGVLDLADHRHDLGAIGMKPVHPRSGIAEAGGIDRHLFLDHHFHLRLEEFLREQLRAALAHFRRARRAHGRCSIDFRKLFAIHEVAGELLVFAHQMPSGFSGAAPLCGAEPRLTEAGRSVSTPKRFVGHLAGLADPATQLVRRARRGAQDAEPPGIRYRSRERGDARPAHPGQKDRVLDPENFAYAALERHVFLLQQLALSHSSY